MAEEHHRRLAAVWFADIVGYTALSERDGDAALRLVAELQAISEREVASRSGRVVKYVGDAVLATFESAGGALEAALALRDGFLGSPSARELKANLRIGIHVGEILTAEDGDVYGDGVNTASRVQGAAAPGQVILSSFASESIRHRSEFRTVPKGKRRFKGLSHPMELFAVGHRGAEDPFVELELAPDRRSSLTPGRAIAIGLAAGMAGLVGLGLFAGASPFFGGGTPDMGPQGEEVDVALSLGIEAYYRGATEEAAENLNLFLNPAGTVGQRRQGLRYLARTELMAGDTAGARTALSGLLTTEPPLALLIPSLEDSALMGLYFDARREKIRAQGIFEPSREFRELMVFDFQVFAPESESEAGGMSGDVGYVVAFMLETELSLSGLSATSIQEMSFENRGDEAYVDLESALSAMNGAGPSHLLSGSVAINSTGALLSAWLYELETGNLVLSEQVNGSHEDLVMSLPEELAARLTARLMGGDHAP
ncbi:adenylate/guanylate cyclase domain-containing protein [Gemmatimonadota bacterium]